MEILPRVPRARAFRARMGAKNMHNAGKAACKFMVKSFEKG